VLSFPIGARLEERPVPECSGARADTLSSANPVPTLYQVRRFRRSWVTRSGLLRSIQCQARDKCDNPAERTLLRVDLGEVARGRTGVKTTGPRSGPPEVITLISGLAPVRPPARCAPDACYEPGRPSGPEPASSASCAPSLEASTTRRGQSHGGAPAPASVPVQCGGGRWYRRVPSTLVSLRG